MTRLPVNGGSQSRAVLRTAAICISAFSSIFCWHQARSGGKPFLMKTSALFVGLDVGGTSMKAGVVTDDGQPLSAVSLPTESFKGQAFGLERMCETIRLAIS